MTSHHTSFCIDTNSEKRRKIAPSNIPANPLGYVQLWQRLVKERINKARSMLLTEVLPFRVYTFDNGILMQHLWRELQRRFGKEGGFLSFFMKREKKGRCFSPTTQKMVCTKISRLTKKYITSLNIQIVDKCFLQKQNCIKRI
jgi:hypothetical protein